MAAVQVEIAPNANVDVKKPHANAHNVNVQHVRIVVHSAPTVHVIVRKLVAIAMSKINSYHQ